MALLINNSITLLIIIKLWITLVQCRISVKYNITENTPLGYVIGNIPEDTNLRTEFADEVFPTLSYQFLQNSPYLDYLDLNENSGILKIKLPLDREMICTDKAVCDINMYVTTKPTAHRKIIEVTLHVHDVNDNTPSFEESTTTVEISENTQPGMTKYALPPATDPDFETLSIVGYSLHPPMDEFSLEVISNPVGSSDLNLQLLKRLDRETIDHYSLKVLAWDGGNPAKTGTLSVMVNVADSNDNAPQFTKPLYNVQVPENIHKGSTLIYVKAVDPDHSSNGEVIYKFSRSTQSQYGHLFNINEDTGEIYTYGELDYEQGSIYSLTVVASDRGIDSISSTTKVIINITNENDNPPIISISGLGESGRVVIEENSNIETLIAVIDVRDPEGDTNSKVTCEMSSNYFMLKEVSINQYEIVTGASFNRESVDEYHITLTCQDNENSPQTADQVIKVFVTDTNDNPPVFQYSQYNASLLENGSPGEHVITIAATDLDINENADITYSLQVLQNDSTLTESTDLMIFPHNGSIVTIDSFDREKQDSHKFIITATDDGNPKLSSTTILSLVIFDENDEPPKFVDMESFSFGTYENQPLGTEIGTVTATDLDLFPNNEIVYSILSSTQDSNAFRINEQTGKITTKKMLDRESVQEYHLVILASNPGQGHLQSRTDVTVYVADKNDNPPKFDFPQPRNNTVNIKHHITKGDTVAHVLARDADLGKNAKLMYSISKGNNERYFDINMLGEVFLTRKLNIPAEIKNFNLDITVRDKGDIPLHSTSTLKIFINGTALVKPESQFLLSKSENIKIIIVVLTSVLVVIVFTFILLFVLFAMRRKKNHQSRSSANSQNPERRNSASCIEATKALLTMGGLPQPPNTGNDQLDPEAPPEHESMDSGVDMPPMEDPRQGNHDMLTWGKQRQNKCHQSSDPSALMETPQIQTSLLPSPTDDLGSQDIGIHQKPYILKSPGEMTEIQLRVHEMLYNLNNLSHDTDSSTSDSGKGPSEEGDTRDNPEELELTNLNFSPNYAPRSLNKSWKQPQNMYQPVYSSPTHSPSYAGNLSQTFPKKTQACKPILKLSQQNPDDGVCQSPTDGYVPQTQQPFSYPSNNKKKTVHFVKPYSCGQDSQNQMPYENQKINEENTNNLNAEKIKPSYIYCPSPKPLHNKLRGQNKRKTELTNDGPNYTAQPTDYYTQKPPNHKYFDIWGNADLSRITDEEDGYSDGGTTTSGSYCMDTTIDDINPKSGCFSIDSYPNQKHDVYV